jgi:hypothetical protein
VLPYVYEATYLRCEPGICRPFHQPSWLADRKNNEIPEKISDRTGSAHGTKPEPKDLPSLNSVFELEVYAPYLLDVFAI